MIEVISKNGGHLAPNLGVVELTLALHKVFNCPKDKIIWDVGHQSYIHKIITGRREAFKTLRQYNGIPAFLKFRKANTMHLEQVIPALRYQPLWAWRLRVT